MPAKAKARRKPRKVGPLSRAASLATVDKRTFAGRIIAQVRVEMIQHVGGDPSVAELLLIENIATKSCRVALLARALAAGEDIGADPHHILAWQNSLRLDLQALGLKRRSRDVTPTLKDVIEGHANKRPQRAVKPQPPNPQADFASSVSNPPQPVPEPIEPDAAIDPPREGLWQ